MTPADPNQPTELRPPHPRGLAEDRRVAQSERQPEFADGRYTIEEVIGRGGMGLVYRAFDRELRRQVALKVTRERVDADRFLEEARVTSQLEHPAIIPVYDLGRTTAGRLFYTMRLVEGRTLAELILEEEAAFWGEVPARVGGWSFARLIAVLVTVCRAVEFAHQRGVLHRDLKPANVMIGPYGTVYVVDWGLAKVLDHDQVEVGVDRAATQAHAVVGTPIFMAPEQASSESGDLRPSADVYALGGMLYLLLTGTAPREGRASEIWKRIASKQVPTAPRALDPSVPEELEQVCLAALDPTPEARPTAGELAESLMVYLAGGAPPAAG